MSAVRYVAPARVRAMSVTSGCLFSGTAWGVGNHLPRGAAGRVRAGLARAVPVDAGWHLPVPSDPLLDKVIPPIRGWPGRCRRSPFARLGTLVVRRNPTLGMGWAEPAE